VEGKGIGRYIETEDDGELADVHDPTDVVIHDARGLYPPPALEVNGFELHYCPT